MSEFGSATTKDGVLHLAITDAIKGNVAACDSSLAVGWVAPYAEQDGWRVCRRSACRKAQTEARRALPGLRPKGAHPRIEAHRHDCGCKGCAAARRREARGEQDRTPPWPKLRDVGRRA